MLRKFMFFEQEPPERKNTITARKLEDYCANLEVSAKFLSGKRVLNFGCGGSNLRKDMEAKPYFGDGSKFVEVDIENEQVLTEVSSSAMMALFEGTVGDIKKGTITVKVAKVLEVKVNESVSSRFGGRCLITKATQAMVLGLPDVGGNIVVAPDFTDYSISKFEALQAQTFVSPIAIRTHIPAYTLKKPNEYADIVDFAPTAVYANPSESILIFYK
jgi:hypothetical protein